MASGKLEVLSTDPGTIHMCKDFVDEAEEAALLTWLEEVPVEPWADHNPLRRFAFTHPVYDGVEIARQEAAAGWPIWVDGRPSAGPTIPDLLAALMRRAQSAIDEAVSSESSKTVLTSVYVDRYRPGVGFVPHIDRNCYGEHIVGVSLGAGTCRLRFRNVEQPTRGIDITLPPRSVYSFSGPLRWSPWTHEIVDVFTERVSITYRGASARL